MLWLWIERHERFQRFTKTIRQRATYATIGQINLFITAGLDKLRINVDITKVVDQQCDALWSGIKTFITPKYSVHQRRLPGP